MLRNLRSLISSRRSGNRYGNLPPAFIFQLTSSRSSINLLRWFIEGAPTPTDPNGHHYRRQSHSGLIVSTTNDNSERISSEALLSLHNKAHIM